MSVSVFNPSEKRYNIVADTFTSLAHHMDLNWLEVAYRRTRKDGAIGVDGQTEAAYEEDLIGNLRNLLEQAKSGRYVAPPVHRVSIPKADGKGVRPIGIPTLEDKVLQRAVVMLMEPLFEQDFADSSFGFRSGRSAHQALEDLWRRLTPVGGGWGVLEIDIQAFFDHLDWHHLRSFLRQRVRDDVICRLIDKWLMLEAGQRHTRKREPRKAESGRLQQSCIKESLPEGNVLSSTRNTT